MDESVLGSGCSLAEARILYEIGYHQSITAREIRKYITIDEGYLSRSIGKLLNADLVIRSQSLNDKRQFQLRLSSKGEKYLVSLNKTANEAISELIDDLSDTDAQKLTSSMNQIEQLLQKNGTP